MSQKAFVIIFLLVTVIAVTGLMIEKLNNPASPGDSLASPSPSSSDTGLNFSGLNPSSALGATPAPSATPLTQQQVRQVKAFTLLPPEELQNKKVVIETDKGTIEFELFPEASMAASNFIYLAQSHFYDGLTFHRVEPGFVVQGGDPNGNGTGGPGYRFPDELNDNNNYYRGIVAMANSGPDTNGSQFFIMLADHPELPHKYTIFGKVISGMDVVDKIAVGDVMKQVSISSL